MVAPKSNKANTQPQPPVVVLDACILISNVLRYLSLELAAKGYFQPAWSAIIGDEWLRNAARLWQVAPSQLEVDWAQWQVDFPLADQGNIQPYKAGLQYSDPKDWHVIAAARAAQVQFPQRSVGILTRNIKDFNRSELARLGIERLQPDAFFCALWPFAEADFRVILARLPAAVTAPDKTPLTVVELLKRERLFNLNQCLREAAP